MPYFPLPAWLHAPLTSPAWLHAPWSQDIYRKYTASKHEAGETQFLTLRLIWLLKILAKMKSEDFVCLFSIVKVGMFVGVLS